MGTLGAVAVSRDGQARVPAVPVTVVDTVGAGDNPRASIAAPGQPDATRRGRTGRLRHAARGRRSKTQSRPQRSRAPDAEPSHRPGRRSEAWMAAGARRGGLDACSRGGGDRMWSSGAAGDCDLCGRPRRGGGGGGGVGGGNGGVPPPAPPARRSRMRSPISPTWRELKAAPSMPGATADGSDAHPEDRSEQQRPASGLAHAAEIGRETDPGQRHGDQRESGVGERTLSPCRDQPRCHEGGREHEEHEEPGQSRRGRRPVAPRDRSAERPRATGTIRSSA